MNDPNDIPEFDRVMRGLVKVDPGDLPQPETGTFPDESELHRLCEMLEDIDSLLPKDSTLREALQKAALALHDAFVHGARRDIEERYADLDKPLSQGQLARLRDFGIELPEASD